MQSAAGTAFGRLALVAVTAGMAFACVGAAPAAAAKHPRIHLTTVNVAVVSSYDQAAMYLGAREGFFMRHGILIHPIPAASGPAGIALVLSGSADVGMIVGGAFLRAVSNGAPLKIVTVSSTQHAYAKPGVSTVGLLVRPDSGITSWKDLQGHNVGVFSLGAIDPICVKLAVAKDGGDPAKVNFVALPSANLGEAMAQGQVDAIQVADPFLTQFVLQYKPRELGDSCGYTLPTGAPNVLYFTTQQDASAKTALLEQFGLAIQQSVKFAATHLKLLKEVVSKYAILPPALVPELRAPTDIDGVWNAHAFGSLAQLLLNNGFLTSMPQLPPLYPIVP